MPTYLCRGFRWYRRSIRVFVILNNLDDCAPDWIVEPVTAAVLLSHLAELFAFVPRLELETGEGEAKGEAKGEANGEANGEAEETRVETLAVMQQQQQQQPGRYDEELSMPPARVPRWEDKVLMHDWSPVKLLEEYDEKEMGHAARPYAYMADYAVRVDLGADVAAAMAAYKETLRERNAVWFERLRMELQPEEETRWYVVVCDDMERGVGGPDGEEEEEEEDTDGDTIMGANLLTEETATGENGQRQATVRRRVIMAGGFSSCCEEKALPSVPVQEQELGQKQEQEQGQNGRRVPVKSSRFVTRDVFESAGQQRRAPGRLKKRMSLRRLFSKKDG